METRNGSKNGTLTSGHRYVFDNFEIDPANRILSRDGETVPLTGKVFDVLLVLTENPGRLLEKDELIGKVWHNGFVEEGNLARNVSTLRKALRDVGKDHKYIATVQGHGYRFIADVVLQQNNAAPNAEAVAGATDEPQQLSESQEKSDIHAVRRIGTGLYRRPWFFSIAGFCLIGIVLVASRFESFTPRQYDLLSFERVRQAKLTQDGKVYSPLISPDGQYLAYSSIDGNQHALYLRQIATGSVLELQPYHLGTEYWALAFAPDNSFLYYILKERDADYGNIYRVPLLGGQPHQLIQHADGGLAVSPDGRKIAFTRIDRQAGKSAIVAADNDGSNEQVVISADLDSSFTALDWAPDGKSFVYSFKRREVNRDYWYLAQIPTTGGEESRIGSPSDSSIMAVRWLPDMSGLIVNAVDASTRQPQVYAVSYPDGTMRRITNDLNNYVGISITADGRSIVALQTNTNRQIWNVPEGNSVQAVQISNGTEKHFDLVSWQGDDHIVFDQDENGSLDNYNVFRVRADGTEQQQLTFGPANNTNPAVSPDGEMIAFVSNRTGKDQLWRMSADGRNVTRLIDIPNSVIRPAFAPDGKSIYFSVSVAGQCHIWQVATDGGTPSQVVDADVYLWAISRDGNYIAYSAFDKDTKAVRTHIRSLHQDEIERVMDIAPETWIEWAGDGKAVYFNTEQDGTQNIWRQPLGGSKPQPVTAFNSEQMFRFIWSPNGKNLACIRHTTTFDAVMLRFDQDSVGKN